MPIRRLLPIRVARRAPFYATRCVWSLLFLALPDAADLRVRRFQRRQQSWSYAAFDQDNTHREPGLSRQLLKLPGTSPKNPRSSSDEMEGGSNDITLAIGFRPASGVWSSAAPTGRYRPDRWPIPREPVRSRATCRQRTTFCRTARSRRIQQCGGNRPEYDHPVRTRHCNLTGEASTPSDLRCPPYIDVVHCHPDGSRRRTGTKSAPSPALCPRRSPAQEYLFASSPLSIGIRRSIS